MRALVRVSVLLALALLSLAACGGGGGGASPTGASAAASEAAPSTAPSEGAASTEPSAAASSGGGTTVGVCELVTADELAGIFGGPVTTTVLAGPPDNCIVSSAAGPVAAWSLSTAQAQAVYQALTSDPSTVDVPGIGDNAAIVQNTGLLVLKGSNLLVISISGGANMSDEEGLEASKQIGTLAAGRL